MTSESHISPETPLDFCLLIPCYNNPEGLKRSLQSICYSNDNYLIVIVDDGSVTPITVENLASEPSFCSIHLIRLAKNSGITAALNTGLRWILDNTSAPFIARLDCGDLCGRERFTEQVDYLKTHPEVGLLGSWCRFKDYRSGASYVFQAPAEDARIRKAMYSSNSFIHPTVMFRSALAAAVGLYPTQYPHAEDYAFFWTLLKLSKGAILQCNLVTCNVDATGISSKHRKAQLASCRKIIAAYGTQPLLKSWGICKTWMRQAIPQRLLFLLKRAKSS